MENLQITLMGGTPVVRWEKGGARFSVLLEQEPYAEGELRGRDEKGPVRPFKIAKQPTSMGNRHPLRINKSVPDPTWRGRTGQRKTSYLDATAKANAPMVAKVLAEAERLELYEQAVVKRDADLRDAAEKRLNEQADKARAALTEEIEATRKEGNFDGADALRKYLHYAEREALARFLARMARAL